MINLDEWIELFLAVLPGPFMWLSIAHYLFGDTQSAIYSLLLAMALTQAKGLTK